MMSDLVTRDVVVSLIGEDGFKLINYLKDKENVSEFIIAEDLGLDIHYVRTILYKCHEHNLLKFNRKKDKQKGWYVCYWDFNPSQIEYLKNKQDKNRLKHLKQRLQREQNEQFFMCSNSCTRMEFYKAAEFNFHCPECNEIMNLQDNKRTIEFLQEQIQRLTT